MSKQTSKYGLYLVNPLSKPEKKYNSINYTQIITVLISALAFCFTVYSYFLSEHAIDRRRNNNTFYDEKYRIIKEVTKSISEITSMVVWNSVPYSDSVKALINNKATVFCYAYLILQVDANPDSIILSEVENYQYLLSNIIREQQGPDFDAGNLDAVGKSVIVRCSKILIHEKDSINSFKFSFF